MKNTYKLEQDKLEKLQNYIKPLNVKYSIQEIAKRLGVSKSVISNIINGDSVSLSTYNKIFNIRSEN